MKVIVILCLWTVPLLLWNFSSPTSLCHDAFEPFFPVNRLPWKCYWCTKPCEQSLLLQPTTISDLQRNVVSNTKIRVIGTGHSTNSLYCNNAVLISLSNMCFINTPQITNDLISVKVGSGCQIHHVQKQLSRRGLHLRGFGAISDQQIGGSIMTSLHGMKSFYSFADHVQAITAVLANGELYKLTKENETLNAWPSSLGTLGIIVDVTFEVFPIQVMSCNYSHVDIEGLQNKLLDEQVHAFQAVTIYPLRKMYQIKYCKIIPEQNWTILSHLLVDNVDSLKVAIYNSFVLLLTYMFSAIFPHVLASALHDQSSEESKIELTTEFRTTSYRNPYFDQEYSVPIQQCSRALNIIQDLIGDDQYSVIIRKVKSNSFWMSWAYENDICAIGTSFLDYGKLKAYTNHINFRLNAEKKIQEMNGSAHTGKLWVSDTSLWNTEQINKFNMYRRSLDPNNKFQNNYTKQLLGQGVRYDAALPISLQSRMIMWKTSMWFVWIFTLIVGFYSCAELKNRHRREVCKVSEVTVELKILESKKIQTVKERERAMFIRHHIQGL